MRFYIGLFFCVVCFLFSCGEPSGDAPNGMLTMPQMAEVLTDIHIVDGSLANVPVIPDSLAKHGLGLYLGVFKIHHIDSAEFRKTLQYYTSHPDVLYVIYEGVNRRLNHKLDSLNKVKAHLEAVKRKDPHFKADSIKLAHHTDSLQRVRAAHTADSIKKANEKMMALQRKMLRDAQRHKVKPQPVKHQQSNPDAIP